jgi:hypothetical protein
MGGDQKKEPCPSRFYPGQDRAAIRCICIDYSAIVGFTEAGAVVTNLYLPDPVFTTTY